MCLPVRALRCWERRRTPIRRTTNNRRRERTATLADGTGGDTCTRKAQRRGRRGRQHSQSGGDGQDWSRRDLRGCGGWSRAPGPFEQLLEWAGSPTSATQIRARVDGTYHRNGLFKKIHGLILTGARLRKIHGPFTHLTIYWPLAELDHVTK
jgi:hypothetical protein